MGGWTISQSQRADITQLHLLFAKGKRPSRDAIRAFAARQQAVDFSQEPISDDDLLDAAAWPDQVVWAELLCHGLTFDLIGLAPGQPGAFPVIEHRFDLAEMPTAASYDALSIIPGPHIAAGGRSLPVVRAMLALARDLALCFDDLAAVCWAPSRSAIGRRFSNRS
ncbi:MAG: hypothetical protein U0995_04010, partial [Erythrobacter sp.]|nr:hypothetical protein [Erythrobacter sp.]